VFLLFKQFSHKEEKTFCFDKMATVPLPVMTAQAIKDGLASVQNNQLVKVTWSYDASAVKDSPVWTWTGRIISIAPDRASAQVFYWQQDGMPTLSNGEAGIEVTMPRQGVLYHSIIFTQAVNTSSEALFRAQMQQQTSAPPAPSALSQPVPPAPMTATHPVAIANVPQSVSTFPADIAFFNWYDPTSWGTMPPSHVLLHIQAHLAINEMSSATRRRGFALLTDMIMGAYANPHWQMTRTADAIYAQIRMLRDSCARERGVDMTRLAKELADEETDPYLTAIAKAGLRGRGTSSRGRGRFSSRKGECWTCGSADHFSPDCPKNESDATPKNRRRGGRGN
jgi:hypothetical protein